MTMKYFLALFICALTLAGCDDGDLIVDSFNFENTTVQKCTDVDVLYKINGEESLVLNIPETNFPNVETETDTPRIVNITGSTSLTYRKYSGTATAANICSTPTLTVLEEWNVVGGTVEITTIKVFDTDGTTVVGYNHNIVFKNITFVTPEKEIVYDSYVFGNYRTDVIDLEFDYVTAAMQNCDTNNLVFKYNTNNALLLDVPATLFANEETLGTPREALINTTTHKVVYRVYSGSLNANYFCSAITPATPTLTEEWVADNGVDDVSGIIKVETVAIDATHWKHTIKLFNTIFRKGIYTYSPAPGADYTFGEYITE
jgi:hypothetical protein